MYLPGHVKETLGRRPGFPGPATGTFMHLTGTDEEMLGRPPSFQLVIKQKLMNTIIIANIISTILKHGFPLPASPVTTIIELHMQRGMSDGETVTR